MMLQGKQMTQSFSPKFASQVLNNNLYHNITSCLSSRYHGS